jgi:hypothetical protein
MHFKRAKKKLVLRQNFNKNACTELEFFLFIRRRRLVVAAAALSSKVNVVDGRFSYFTFTFVTLQILVFFS